MEKKLVISTRFNYSDFDIATQFKINPRSVEWIENRMKIFMTYTRKSFEQQTNQNFIAVLATYEESMPLINELLKKYPPLPSNIIFSPYKEQVITEYIKGSDLLYMMHIDSDDMYHEGYVQKMYDHPYNPNISSLVCNLGYIYNAKEDLLAPYWNQSPSIFTQIFRVKDYTNVYQHYGEISHGFAYRFPYKYVEDRNYVIIVHGKNTWQPFLASYKNVIITDEQEKSRIKKQFAL
ncbi:MAG: hypothetical protein ACRC1P_00620 [Cellulosilyticaceae bacterium]